MYLVVGANGFLGSYIVRSILAETDEDIIATSRNHFPPDANEKVKWIRCDVTNRNDVDGLCDYLRAEKDVNVVYLAAYHNPDLVERNTRLAWDVNITSLSYFINSLENVRCFYYPSTDSVYGDSENGRVFFEGDELNPVNEYGRQKATAESVVRGYGYNVVRLPFLIAPSLAPGKSHFYDAIVEALESGEAIEMFADSLRSTLNFSQAAGFIVRLIEELGSTAPDTINVCGDDALSKYDVGLMIADKIGADRELVIPIRMACSDGIFEAARAQSTIMSNSRLKDVLGLGRIELSI